MTVEDALRFIDDVLAKLPASRHDHAVALQAVETLRAALEGQQGAGD